MLHAFRSSGTDPPFPYPPTPVSRDVLERLNQAPVLAATGYVLYEGAEAGDLPEAWASGLRRLSNRKPFPTDRASFFYRPVELLGIALGTANCSKPHSENLRWLQEVVSEGESKLVSGEPWSLLLGACASQVLARTWHPRALPPFEEMQVWELALLRWICDAYQPLASRFGLSDKEHEIEKMLLMRCAVSSVAVQDSSRAAVLYLALRTAVQRFIESSYERDWQVGKDSRDALELVKNICARFPLFSRQLLSRRENRPTVEVNDEYDVQDLMRALLKLHFDDVRPEEWAPSYAGSSSRIDFLLKPEKIVVETKMTRRNLDQKKVADELTIDKSRYRTHPDCRTLVAFVYDPEGRCTNPAALETDLSEEDDRLHVRVIVAPKGT